MRFAFWILAAFGLGALLCLAENPKTPERQGPPVAAKTGYVPVDAYDAARDAEADIRAAVSEAQKTGKRILLEIGGDWCPWCHALAQFFHQNPDVLKVRNAAFVVVNIYYSPENKNERVLARYSKVLGIPHFFILDETGTLLHSQHVVELQTNGAYSAEKMKEFVNKWSRPTTKPVTAPQ